jgi:hypothetical protein
LLLCPYFVEGNKESVQKKVENMMDEDEVKEIAVLV